MRRAVQFHQAKQIPEAIAAYKRAIAIKPDSAAAYNNLGVAFVEQVAWDEAVASFKKAVSLQSDFAEGYKNLGDALKEQNKNDEAIASYKRALAINPNFSDVYKEIGNVLRNQGKFDDAITFYKKAIAVKPNAAGAYYNLATTRKCSDLSEIRTMQALLAKETNHGTKTNFCFALSKSLLDMQYHAEAFHYLLEANRLQRDTFRFDIQASEKMFKRIAATFDADFFKKRAHFGCQDKTPVFILGMPRSGSTLIEQILASHRDVYGAGELPFMRLLVMGDLSEENIDTARFCRLTEDDASALGEQYIAKIRAIEPRSPFITDKMPGNFLYIGMIKMILPHAKIIHSIRLPEATCFSIFQQRFSGHYGYAYHLEELGKYYRLYAAMMAHWKRLFPKMIYDLHYEQLIENQESETRKLLSFCGLAWDARCLDFHTTVRSVQTASKVQVRQPLYRGSVEGWRRFETQLRPLLHALGDVASVHEEEKVGNQEGRVNGE